ncbi:diguanylate cyclase (GGDEF)-like protein/PAS domain S-box-containing protein [Arthrobacter sp. CAN_A2]|uniref:putative bifunctional diguanylate cyclase/phosphodiesterase n=1 Tax=Arthrobacter sp. CAN_A2 TaxID=2787718 RepID=UPI0018EF52DA
MSFLTYTSDGHTGDRPDGRSVGGDGSAGDSVNAVLAAAREATSDIAVISDAQQNITHVSASFTAMTGYEPADILGLNCRILQGPGTDPETTSQIRELLASGQQFEGQILNYRKDGSAFWNDLKITPLRVGSAPDITHFVSVQQDISNRVALITQLEAQAIHDRVTGLPNRIAAERAVDDAVHRFPDKDLTSAICLIDLDDFRIVNNTLGHAAGDAVLQQWATRVLARLRDGDVLARMGGDEFLLILANIARSTSHEDLTTIVNRIHEAVEDPFTVEGQQTRIGMSMGIALIPEDGTDSRSILRSADEALYSAKKRHSHSESWWETAAHAHAHPAPGEPAPETAEKSRAEDYRAALRTGHVVVHFQPIVDLRDGSITLFEALARLNLSEGRIAFPDEFLPHLNSTDLRILFDQILDQALALIAGWDRPGTRPNVAVNLPPEILHEQSLPAHVAHLLHTHGIEPGGLGLELLESNTMNLETQRAALEDLAGLGVRLAMDDLGSGHSSLQRLSSFPFTAIKLDRGLFLHAYDRPLETLSIMATLIQMGRDLGKTVVIEGLEDESLTEAATILGAPLGQGYYFAKPMPADNCGPWADTFDHHLHHSPLRTPLGALAYHWQFVRLAAPHPLNLDQCPLTHFIHTTSTDTDTSPETCLTIDAGPDVESWHELQHTPQGVHPTSSRRLIDWLTHLTPTPANL